ncbi:hemerythrin domain-containing protein [Litchfieldia alkalitelluris]|uniref:hemerythrin domain-containing protein n=1 Tax=Litchfieldia alkalitelluris TaxID=304268 RepID=UPI000998A9C9|nr:hemerythrin domain-containing protein [Litchfieldia alkalitelluris]
MEFQPRSCGMMSNEEQTLSLPLQLLKNEHIPLRKQMDHLYEEATNILENSTPMKAELIALREVVVDFVNHLDPHSDIEDEEGVLFPLVANYIGRETGPIAVMEFEHDQAKKHLKLFLQGTEKVESLVENEFSDITLNITEAILILREHFMKEENVLFPLAERMLSEEEKAVLQEKLEKSI